MVISLALATAVEAGAIHQRASTTQPDWFQTSPDLYAGMPPENQISAGMAQKLMPREIRYHGGGCRTLSCTDQPGTFWLEDLHP